MKFLKILGIIIIVLVVVIVVLALVAPKEFSVEKTVVIDAPRPVIFRHVQYWQNWQNWSPWAEADTTIKTIVEGTDGQVGSMSKWESKDSGSGEMTNTGVKLNEEITYHLRFIEPWESESDGYMRLSETDGGTQVAWGFYGDAPMPWNVMYLFINMDKMIGKDFDLGLELLKQRVEKDMQKIEQYEIENVTFTAKTYAAIQDKVNMDKIHDFFMRSFGTISENLAQSKQQIAGAPSGLYYEWDEQKGITDMAAAIPLRKAFKTSTVKIIQVPRQKNAFMIDFYGPYEESALAHYAFDSYFKKNNLTVKVPIIEEYITDPANEPDSSKWLTKIYYFAQ